MKPKQIINLLKNQVKQIPREKIYFTLRKLRVHPIRKETVEIMCICMALHNQGIPITTELMIHLRGVRSTTSLHTLGDKKALTLLRPKSNPQFHKWIISDVFKNYYNGKR